MSYDIGVWVGESPPDVASAIERFQEHMIRLEGEPEPPHPAILAYIEELTSRYPDLTELPDEDVDESPWADGPLVNNATGPFYYFSMTYSGAEKALEFVAEAAARRGLVCFDPQGTRLI